MCLSNWQISGSSFDGVRVLFSWVFGHYGIIAFITEAAAVRDILIHLGEPITPPTIAPARGPPLWEMRGTRPGAIDPQAQPAPDYPFDQRIAW